MTAPHPSNDKPLDQIFRDVRSEIVHEEKGPRSWRQLPTWSRRLLAVAVSAAIPLYWLFASPSASLKNMPGSVLGGVIVVYLVAMASGVWLTTSVMTERRVGPIVRRILVLGALAGAVVVTLLPSFQAGRFSSGTLAVFTQFGAEMPKALHCLIAGTVSAWPVAALLILLDRRGRGFGQATLDAVLAALALGLLSLFLHCPQSEAEHLWLGHIALALPLLATFIIFRRKRRS